MNLRSGFRIVGAVLVTLATWRGLGTSPAPPRASFTAFESGQVRPLALSPDGTRLVVANTPDNRLEVFDVADTGLVHAASVPVGMEPVAVAWAGPDEVWVVNHVSDSVSVVRAGPAPPRVIRTLLVGDEPRDLVFAGPGRRRAFITTAHRGQNSPVDARLTTPGIGRADVWVFDADDLGSALGGTPLHIVTLFGDTPRALAATPDGRTVYAAVFLSGNRTTTLNEGAVADGQLPPPSTNVDGVPAPETGLIVRFDGDHWVDETGRAWDEQVRFSLPDLDVFAIDAFASPPAETHAFASVGTVLFDMIVNPVNGNVYVANTEARNEVRFEGPGVFGGSSVRGHLHESRITVLDGASVVPRHLNPHIDYAVVPGPPDENAKSLAFPVGMAVTSDGATLYVSAFGSSKIGVIDTSELEAGTRVPSASSPIAVSGGGPTGLVLDESRGRIYALTRFDNAVSVIDTGTNTEIAHLPLYNPEPPVVVRGRPLFYDASFTSSHGDSACASCHVFADLDGLAWDLGNPDAGVLDNPNPFRVGPVGDPDFHPMKGPMATQSLRGLAGHGPMHWRGDRTGGHVEGGDPLDEEAALVEFNVAFGGLLGREGPLDDAAMRDLARFLLEIVYPPNPIRALDNSLGPAQQRGRDFFFDTAVDAGNTCDFCHRTDPAIGLFGTDGLSSFEGETQHFKIAHLRNLYQKVGMFGMPEVPFFRPGDNGFTGDQVRGFGFLHDGSVDTVLRFLRASVFNFSGGDAQRRDLEEFLFAFPSNLAPIVGQQITLASGNASVAGPRIDLLLARAGTSEPGPECDVVVKGTVEGLQRGWYRQTDGRFRSDRAAEPLLADPELRALAETAGQELTYTCAPPGAGARMGVDRDEDGFFDRDELDAGSDPASPEITPEDSDGDGTFDGLDCAPDDPAVHPGADETCDLVDNDCDPTTSDGSDEPWVGAACDGADPDRCHDGVSRCELGAAVCSDDANTRTEVCDGVDTDCNGQADDPRCDAFDVDRDGVAAGAELAWIGRSFGACSTDPAAEWWEPVDYDRSGCVDGDDLAILANLWARPCSGGIIACEDVRE